MDTNGIDINGMDINGMDINGIDTNVKHRVRNIIKKHPFPS
jgi:hypothetical protein